MHQNAFGGRAPSGTTGVAYSAPQDPLAVFGRGAPPPKGKRNGEGKGKREEGRGRGKREGREMEKRGRGGERKGGERKEGEGRECAPASFTGAPHFLIPGVALEPRTIITAIR